MSTSFRACAYTGILFAVVAVGFICFDEIRDAYSDNKKLPRLGKCYDQEKWNAALANDTFPKEFFLGVSTSAYQTEGTWNLTGESAWDYMIRTQTNLIKDGSNASIAADSYHKYKDDVRLAKSIGCNMFRISLSWSRILPDYPGDNVNEGGIKYYNDVINEMIANNIRPMVTLLHGDLPNYVQKRGGIPNPLFVDSFTEYARIAFTAFGDRVKHWITFNDPVPLCTSLYGGKIAFAVNESGAADYRCGHNVLLAHAKVYHTYRQEFHERQKGEIGIAYGYSWFEVADGDSDADIRAAENSFAWSNGWLTNPIFGIDGDYPSIMRYEIGLRSSLQGYSTSRLPTFTEKQIREIKGSADFLGLNYDGVKIVEGTNRRGRQVSFQDDAHVLRIEEMWDKLALYGFVALTNYLNDTYRLPEIYLTESGYADVDDVEDLSKVLYLHALISAALHFMQNGIKIRGYLVRTLVDSFEWTDGYQSKYGLFRVDFNDINRTRTPRLSSKLIAEIYKNRNVKNTLKFLSTHASNKTLG